MFKKNIYILFVVLMFMGCAKKYIKSPLDELIKNLPKDRTFSIILHDMDVRGNFTQTYYHKYEIIKGSDVNIKSETTDWLRVSEKEFNRYVNDMGMEITARDSVGKLTKAVAPPGYNNYVGNAKYGHWQNQGGHSFWAFYGQYAFMSTMFRMGAYPVRRSYYNDWNGNYRQTNRRYYGPSSGSSTYYGTSSRFNRTRNPSSTWNSNKANSFKNRVRNRTTRSSNRGSSSYRSRSRSFGK